MIETLKAGKSKTVKANARHDTLICVVPMDKNFKLSNSGETRGLAYEQTTLEIENPHSEDDNTMIVKISAYVKAYDDQAEAQKVKHANKKK